MQKIKKTPLSSGGFE